MLVKAPQAVLVGMELFLSGKSFEGITRFMKKLISFALSFSLIFSLCACSRGAVSTATGSNSKLPPQEPALKIAIILPSSPQDGGWGQFGAEGMEYAAEELGAELAIVEATAIDAIQSECESLADDGYRVIIGHGGQYSTPFSEVASNYPEVDFISVGGSIYTENLFALQMANEPIAFVQGVVAAKLSKTGIVGTINAMDIPAFTKTNKAFEAGAKYINPDITVLYTVMTVYGDPNEGYEIAYSQIAEGADHINSNADLACYGIAKACQEKGVTFSGYGAKFDEYPETVLNSIDNNFGPAFLAAVRRCLDKDSAPITPPLRVGLAEGAVSLKINEALYAKLPADVQSAMDDLKEPMLNGKIKVPSENDLY